MTRVTRESGEGDRGEEVTQVTRESGGDKR